MHCEESQHSHAAQPPTLLLSRSSILILSGVLVGMGVAQGVALDTQFYTFVAAIVGLLAFLALDSHARQKERRAARRAHKQAACVMEDRLCRHIPATKQSASHDSALMADLHA